MFSQISSCSDPGILGFHVGGEATCQLSLDVVLEEQFFCDYLNNTIEFLSLFFCLGNLLINK